MNNKAKIFSVTNIIIILLIALIGWIISKFPDQSIIGIGCIVIIIIGYALMREEK